MLTRQMITRGVRRQNKTRREFLREPRDGLIVFGNACNNVANARKFFVGLATVLQTPKSFSWDLQQCCKRQKVFRGTCNSVANAEKFFAGLATVLQTPKSFSKHLQHSCKGQKVFRGICSIPASLLVWRKPKEGSGKNDRFLGDKCIGSNGFASAKKRQSVGIDEDGA